MKQVLGEISLKQSLKHHFRCINATKGLCACSDQLICPEAGPWVTGFDRGLR